MPSAFGKDFMYSPWASLAYLSPNPPSKMTTSRPADVIDASGFLADFLPFSTLLSPLSPPAHDADSAPIDGTAIRSPGPRPA